MASEKPTVIADASVIAKWFLLERDREKALLLRDDYAAGAIGIASPCLMPFEVINAVRFSRKRIAGSKVRSIGRSLALYGLSMYELKGEFLDLTVETAMRNELTIYDASYVALARHMDSVAYTADEALVKSLGRPDRRYAKHIREYVERVSLDPLSGRLTKYELRRPR